MTEPRTETWQIAARDSSQPLRLLQLTDTHLFADSGRSLYGVNTRESLSAVIAQLKAGDRRPDAVLVTGDLSQDETPESYRILKELLHELDAPLFTLPGNHDDPEAMRAVFNEPAASYCGVIENGNWRIVMLSSWQEKKVGGLLEESELARFSEILATAGKRFILVCVHHQPVAIGSGWLDRIGMENGDDLLSIAQRDERVRGVLWGHVHQVFDEFRGRLRLMSSPSTCRQFEPRSEQFAIDGLAPGWRWLSLFPDGGLETEIQRLGSGWKPGARG